MMYAICNLVITNVRCDMQHSLMFTSIFSISAVVLGVVWFTRKNVKQKVPTKWKSVGKVKGLTIYPLKSGYRMELPKVSCTEFGPKMCQENVHQFQDRNLIIYKEKDNEYISSNTYPKMSLIKVESCSKEDFVLKAPNVPEVVVKIPQNGAKTGNVRTFAGAEVFIVDCGDVVAEWLSRYIYGTDSGLRLGFHDGSRKRNIYENAYLSRYCDFYPMLSNESTGMYAYLCGYSLINQSSINELTKRIADENENITAHNFRGNIIIEDFDGCPYVEDTWSWIKIGDAVFYVVKPKTRCCITAIDPDTAVRSKKLEPLKTLRQYRKLKELTNVDLEGHDPVMGCYLGLHKGGTISIEDTVYVGEP